VPCLCVFYQARKVTKVVENISSLETQCFRTVLLINYAVKNRGKLKIEHIAQSRAVPSIRISHLPQMFLYVAVSVSNINVGIRFLKGGPVSQWTSGYELGTDRSNKIVSHHLEASHVRFRVVAQPVCRYIATTPTCPRQETLRLS
jgi:hypothetical protein